jgi:hypothetical protein
MSNKLTQNAASPVQSGDTANIDNIPGLYGQDLASWLVSGKRIKPQGTPTSNLHALDIARDIQAAWRLGVNPIPSIRKNLPAGWVVQVYHPAKAQWITRLNKVAEDGVFVLFPGLSAVIVGPRISVESFVANKQADYEAWLDRYEEYRDIAHEVLAKIDKKKVIFGLDGRQVEFNVTGLTADINARVESKELEQDRVLDFYLGAHYWNQH